MSAFTYASYSLAATLEAGVTASATSIEVSRLSDGISAGDRVKVAIGPDVTTSFDPYTASAGELVYGVVGTVGGGANGGTDIDLSATEDGRGKEGTTAASHSSGATCVVGVTGRNDTLAAGGADPVYEGWQSPAHTELGASESGTGFMMLGFCSISEPGTITDIAIDIDATGSTDGTIYLVVYDRAYDLVFEESITSATHDLSTTGRKAVSGLTHDLDPGGYWFGAGMDSFTTSPALVAVNNAAYQAPARFGGSLSVTPAAGIQKNTLPPPSNFTSPGFNVRECFKVGFVFERSS